MIPSRKLKLRQGLPGFANGIRTRALPDTGSFRNVVSKAFAAQMKLKIAGRPNNFILGNSKRTRSLGTVTFDWAFSDSPQDLSKIVCDVLPVCTYDLILGSQFLDATKTLSAYKHRLARCIFKKDFLQFNFLSGNRQRLRGFIGANGIDMFAASAVLDTGAECNVIDENFAAAHDLRIRKEPDHRNFLQFADGTYQKTVGQVETFWTFSSGERVPVTFEVLDGCFSDVILGDSILYDNNVFEDHASAITTVESELELYQLAPFDFFRPCERKCTSLVDRFKALRKKDENLRIEPDPMQVAEESRRERWNYQYTFGETATEAERAAELERRRNHDSAMQSLTRTPQIPGSRHANAYKVPGIASVPGCPP